MESGRTVVCPVIVGRDDLLELAGRRLTEVGRGRGHILLIAGEGGIGKTRYVGAIERLAVARGFATTRAGTYPSDLEVAAAILLDLARAMGRSTATRELGERLDARLADLDEAPPAAGDARRRRRLLTLDVADLLLASAANGPALLILEDLHWADDLTLEIIAAVARAIEDVPLLLVGTYRSDELFPRIPVRDWRARLLTQRLAEEVRLRRLSVDETATMIASIAGSRRPIPSDIADAVQYRTDGVPLYVEELLGVLDVVDAAAGGLASAETIAAAGVPDTIEGAILARLGQRSGDAGALAKAGAVIGRSFDLDLLATVLGTEPTTLNEPLAELADHQILLPSRVPGRLGFRHALICDAIYDHMPEPERRDLHLRTAQAAAERPDIGTDAFVSLHFERAGRPAEAFPTAVSGARAAAAIAAHREARDLYRRAVRTAPPELDAGERGAVLEAYATECAATDDNADAAAAYEAARQSYLDAGRPLDAAAVVAPLVAARHLLGDGLEVRAARLTGALDELQALGEPTASAPATERVRGRLLAGLSAAYMLDRRLDDADAYGREAERLAVATGDAATARHVAATLGACDVFAGRMDEGWARLEGAIAAARAVQDEPDAARAYRMLSTSASVLVEYERAETWLREGIDYAERTELWNHRHYMAAHLGHVLWATGEWDAAEALAQASLADGRGGMTTRITALHVLGYVAMGRGAWAAAEEALTEARILGEQMHELQRLAPAVWGLAECALLQGDHATARRLCADGLAASAEVDDAAYLFSFVVTGTRAYLAGADPLGAARWLAEVEPRIRARAIPGTLPSLAHARGLVATADGLTAQARTELEHAVAAWDALGRSWEATWARIDLARCHRRANQRVEARRSAAVAREHGLRLGSPPIVTAADELLRGERARAGASDPWAPLTAREFAVARLVAEGRTNAAIAAELGVAPKTVSAHVEHILAKLGVGRRSEIAAWVAADPVLHSGPHGDDREE